jgi:hypothetical protein
MRRTESMANELLPFQLTAGRLKEILRDVPDATVAALVVPKGWAPDPRFTTFCALGARYPGGPVLEFFPAVESDATKWAEPGGSLEPS